MIKNISSIVFKGISALLLVSSCVSAEESGASERVPVGIRAKSLDASDSRLNDDAKIALLLPEDFNDSIIWSATEPVLNDSKVRMAIFYPNDLNELAIRIATEEALKDFRTKAVVLHPEDFNNSVIKNALDSAVRDERAKLVFNQEDFKESVINGVKESALTEKKVSSKNKKLSKSMAPAYAKSVYYTTHPAVYQRPVSISLFGDSIELVDGSIWAISPFDAYKATSWYSSDLIVITPNHSWFSSNSFRLTNQSTGESVAANITLGPLAPSIGRYTHWIVAIDSYYNIVYLEDGSVWDMSSFDRNVVNQWMAGDVMIVGVNDGWLSSSNPNVLINVATLSFAAGSVSF